MPQTNELEEITRAHNLSAETQVNEHSHPSQEKLILDYLRQGFSLTPYGALKLFNCFRLGARVFNLKKQGYNISSVYVNDGDKKYKRYFLQE